MNLKKSINMYLSDAMDRFGLHIVSYVTEGIDGKTGQPIQVVVLKSPKIAIQFSRRDGAIESKILNERLNRWEFPESESSKNKTIEELLKEVPDSPLSEKEHILFSWSRVEKAVRDS